MGKFKSWNIAKEIGCFYFMIVLSDMIFRNKRFRNIVGKLCRPLGFSGSLKG
ncbi:hypothetical protein [Wielerella bovis]|uniref:hypothetical protein n=1 Tax=Wielerella bovis TaxID=2917790 RepID=UPI00201A0A4E|nr:hypothetical protein [Wielerella bovis]ULJ64348.1 hypothetical protein MIS33_09385 [Wielerella bovis]ULJ66567.1 hypothetical protein MIS31_09990 [Wielerella bovis]